MSKAKRGEPKRAALYARVSTSGQTTAQQLNELRAAAERHGWKIVGEYVDHGGEIVAELISSLVEIRSLEDGPFGGSHIAVGTNNVGQVLDAPVPEEGISDVMTRVGPHHLDLTGPLIKSDGLPQGPFEKIDGVPRGAAYPCLWNHDATRERRLVVLPDSHCRIREVRGRVPERLQERAEARWATASMAHYNTDLRFNSQSIVVAITEQRTLGGRAWPTVVFDNDDHALAFSLWCNSTLGLLCHWWMSNKSQEGRGTTTPTAFPLMPTLDLFRKATARRRRCIRRFIARAFLAVRPDR
jgi:hypothetical protein